MGSEVITVMPMWGSICLGQVILAYTSTTEKIPKFVQTIIGTCRKNYMDGHNK